MESLYVAKDDSEFTIFLPQIPNTRIVDVSSQGQHGTERNSLTALDLCES